MPAHHRPLRVPVIAVALAACSLAALPALAEDPPSGPLSSEDADVLRPISDPPREATPAMVRRSVELYNQGTAHARAGRLKDAYRAFRDAYEQDGSAESLANAAVIEASLGRPRSAANHLVRAISRLGPSRAAEAQALKERLEEVAKELGTIEIRAPGLSTVHLDGVWQGSAGAGRTFYVDPGPHDAVVSAHGAEVKRTMVLKKGEKVRIDVSEAQLQAVLAAMRAPADPAPPAAPAPDASALSYRIWIAGGVAVGLAAVGGIGLGVYLRGHDERVKIEQQTRALGGYCGATPPPGFVDDCRARDQEATNETIGMVMAIAGLGGLGAAGTGVLVAVLADATSNAAAAPAPPRVAIGVGPTGVVLQGSF